jgi:hypothetical protein
MSFVFNPDDGPARIMRYVEPGSLPGSDTLAILDKSKNLLLIDRELFDRLDEIDKHQVLRSRTAVLKIIYRPRQAPTFVAVSKYELDYEAA